MMMSLFLGPNINSPRRLSLTEVYYCLVNVAFLYYTANLGVYGFYCCACFYLTAI